MLDGDLVFKTKWDNEEFQFTLVADTMREFKLENLMSQMPKNESHTSLHNLINYII